MSTSIGELLVETGKLDPADLERARRVQQESDERLSTLLVQLGFWAKGPGHHPLRISLPAPGRR